MGSKTLTLANLAAASRDKGAKARARRVQKRKEQSPAKWLGKEWSVIHRRFFPGAEVEWTGAEIALAKRLIDECGFDDALEMIRHFFDTWDRRKASRSGIPGFRLMWAMRERLVAEMEGRAKVPELRETRINSGEFSEEAAEASPIRGWGEVVDDDENPYEGYGNGW
jgi:hypothetical protein